MHIGKARGDHLVAQVQHLGPLHPGSGLGPGPYRGDLVTLHGDKAVKGLRPGGGKHVFGKQDKLGFSGVCHDSSTSFP